jgi:hypothetical protein
VLDVLDREGVRRRRIRLLLVLAVIVLLALCADV